MTLRKSILLLVSLSMIAALVACSSSSTHVTPVTPISVTLSTTPTALFVGDTTPITATVANDSANAGVTWSCAPAGTCGSFSSATSASGTAVTYTAPSSVPTSTVVITATSVTDTTKSASTPAITINAASGITVTVSTAPPSTLVPGATATITAIVSGDPNSAGVNWSCAPASTCGSFSASTGTYPTFSTTYTAPGTPGVVTITATSVTDNAASASVTVTITSAAAGTLTPSSNYVFSLSGFDTNDNPYFVAGVFTLSSDGATISGGEQDFTDYEDEALSDAITGGTISAPDAAGNVTITLNTGDGNIGPGGDGTETLVATLVSSSKAVIAEYDTWATSSGTLDLQDPTAAAATPSAGYAFFVAGVDWNGYPLAIGGVINVDGGTTNPVGISGTGSIFDANDQGDLFPGEGFVANENSVSSPDALGRVEFALTPDDSTETFLPIDLVGYIVDATHIRLVETADDNASITGGTALGQGANTGKFSSIAGNSYVAGLAGYNPNGAFQGAGLLTAGSSSFTGTVNYNDLSGTAPQAPDSVTEGTTYTVDPTGRVSIPGMTDGNNDGVDFNLQLYLDGNGKALTITMDNNDVLAGLAYQQTVPSGGFTVASFNGTYAMGATGANQPMGNEYELDAVGPVTSAGMGDFTGFVDLNWIFNSGPTADLVMPGAFNTTATNGVFAGYITGLDVTTSTNQDVFSYYLIDSTKGVAIETDTNQLTLGYFLLQR